MKYLMAIDAGTGSIRAVLFDLMGKQVAFSNREWTHLSEEGISSSMRFDCDANWKLTISCIKDITSKIDSKDIIALSSTSMREGIVLYDKDGKELWAVANVDARAGEEVKFLKEHFNGIEEQFYKISGQTFALGALPRLLWLKNHKKDIYDKVAKITMINDWILYKLSGVFSSEPSNAGTSGIFSLKKRDWVSSMAKEIGLKNDIFPPCFEPGTVLGKVSKSVSKECGLSTFTKVVVGGGDVQLGSVGLGVVKTGDAAVLGGSFWQQVVNICDTLPPKDMSIRVNPHVIKGLSQAEGITFFSGLVMRWFRDAFCDKEKEEAIKRGIDAYTVLENKAKSVPVGSNGIMPIFSDAMNYSKWYHASPSFLNLSIDPSVCNKASMFRSLEENAAIVSSLNLEKIKEFAKVDFKRIIFAGGASKGELWPQILSDVTGCEVVVPKVKEATALGAAMAAGVGAGVYKDLKTAAKEIIVWEKTFKPNLENKKIYDDIKQNWQKIYKKELKLVDEGLTKSMWKAPGIK